MFQHVIVPLDGSRGAEQAVPVAARLAKCVGASMVLVRVLEAPGADEAALDAHLTRPSALAEKAAQAELDRIARQMSAAAIPTETRVERGSAAEAILATVAAFDGAIVVMRSRNRGGRLRLGLGSVAAKVVQAAIAPVLVLPYGRRALPPPSPYEPLPQSPLRILVPLDGSPLAEQALPPARELLEALALPGKGEILLVQVVSPFATDAQATTDAAECYLRDVAERVQVKMAPQMRATVSWSVVFQTEVPHALIQVGLHGVERHGAGFDLMVMTTHGEGGLERTVLGGVTEQVLYQTHLPVVVVHPRPAETGRRTDAAEECAAAGTRIAHPALDGTWETLEPLGGQPLPTPEEHQLDTVMLSSLESFPASDAPGWLPHRL